MGRLDSYLVSSGLFESRNKALEAIRNGEVRVDGRVVKKGSFNVKEESSVEVEDIRRYVSRSASKLGIYLDRYPLEISGATALDIGSSTGGFTQVLLEKGAESVDAVDVGREQLHDSLRVDERVRSFEETDIRDFRSDREYDLIVSDISFISLHHILEDIERLSARRCDIILLFKPQFEVGRDVKRDRKGVVLDMDAISESADRFLESALKRGWSLLRRVESEVRGKEGNIEYIYHFIKDCDVR
jgi:23S rRNA (cytidine1920-2'-O)/16S rRNA (cytidine1409-2'-O)-methyltransferase